MIPHALRPALMIQLFYAALVVVWQLVGLALVAAGGEALGPVASLTVALQAIVIATLYVLALRRWPVVFVGLTALSALAAGGTIARAFTADPNLWASDLRRYLGVAVNSVGVIGFLVAIDGYHRWRKEGISEHDRSTAGDATSS